MNEIMQPKKRLYRSRKDRVIAGVCGGLADYFHMDPTWMRLLFVVFFLLGGSAFILYVIMWIIVPVDPT
ncbi:MAG: PspC domain-containing protein [Legionella sp.]|nr:MAG: PspC domain-containing protein [Legionella sp.]